MIKLLLKSLLFTAAFLLLLDQVMDPRFQTPSQFQLAMKEIRNYDKEEVGIIFAGSSHVYTSLNPSVIDLELKTNSFNLGSGAQRLRTTVALLEQVTKDYQPEYVVVDLFPGLSYLNSSEKSRSLQVNVFDNVRLDRSIFGLMTDYYAPREMPSALSPTLRNHHEWDDKLLHPSRGTANLKDQVRGYNNNLISITTRKDKNFDKQMIKFRDFGKTNYDYGTGEEGFPEEERSLLIQLNQLLSERGIRLIITSVPFIDWNKDDTFKKYSSALNKLTDSLGVPYFNFIKQIEQLDLTFEDFKDMSHVNNLGARKVSEQFVRFFREQGLTVKDRSTTENWISNQANNPEFLLRSPMDELPFTLHRSDFRVNDSLQLEGMYLIRKQGGSRQMILKGGQMDQLTEGDWLIHVHEVPYDEDLNLLTELSKSKERNRDVWYVKPETVRGQEDGWVSLSLPASPITKFKRVILFFEDKNLGQITRPGAIWNEIEVESAEGLQIQ